VNFSSAALLTTLLSASLLINACTTPHLGSQRYSKAPQQPWVNPLHHFGVDHPYQPNAPLYRPEPVEPNTNLPRWVTEPPPLSPGDRVQVNIQNGDNINGIYEVDIDGALKLPFIPPLPVAGHRTSHAEQLIGNALVENKMFRADRIRVSVLVQQWAPVQVHVGGAVFSPGLVTANVRPAEDRALKSLQRSGDFPPSRLLPAALRAAGGVRPDAAINHIRLIRNSKTRLINLGGIMNGYPIEPVALMSGDTIIVPSTAQFDSRLVTPSAITPPGIRVFLSNLISPSPGNGASAIGKHATSLPYGTRLLAAAISANCVGGTHTTNGSRHAILVRTDPITGREESLERSVHDLLRSPERNAVNPFIMPNDSIACYDSGITNLRDMARTLGDIMLPLTLIFLLI